MLCGIFRESRSHTSSIVVTISFYLEKQESFPTFYCFWNRVRYKIGDGAGAGAGVYKI